MIDAMSSLHMDEFGKMRKFIFFAVLLLRMQLGMAEPHPSAAAACALMNGLAQLSAETLTPKTPQELPRAAFVILGFFGEYNQNGQLVRYILGDYARKIEKIYPYRRVAHFYNLPEFGYRHPYSQDNLEMIAYAVNKAVELSPGKQPIIVVLDGFSMEKAFRKTARGVQMQFGYLNREVDLILRDPKLFAATRWLRDGRELSSEQIRAEFVEYFPELF